MPSSPSLLQSSRRSFIRSSTLASAALALIPRPVDAIESIQRPGKARLLLSLAAYSFRDQLTAGKISLFDFIDYCADQGCVGAELTSYYFPKEPSDDFLIKVKRHAFMRGVAISGTAVGNTFTHPAGKERDAQMNLVKTWVDRAAIMGAPHIRVFAGSVPKGISAREAKANCIAAMEEACDYAGKKGVFLGIENHGGIVAEPSELVEIVKTVQSPWIGINLDTGNFHTADPYKDLELIAPYAVNVQLKGEITARGKKSEPADVPRLIKMMRDVRYQGFVALEYESKEDPFQAVPRLLNSMKTAIG